MPIVDCGPHVRQGTVYAQGFGPDFDSALDLAEWIGTQLARAQADNWAAGQICQAGCGGKNPVPPNFVAGGLALRAAINPASGWVLVTVTVDWIAWFVCGTVQEASDYIPPMGAVPQQYKTGSRPVKPPNLA